MVALNEITAETVRSICALEVAPAQSEYVAPNAMSIAEAFFQPKAWFRAVYAGEMPVGFAMLYEDEKAGNYFLWRFMIDAEHQGKGYGRQALDLVVEHVRSHPNARVLRSSYVPGDASPGDFYRRYGFVETGEFLHGENVISLTLYVGDLWQAGEYRAVIDRTYLLEHVREATRYLEMQQKTGRAAS